MTEASIRTALLVFGAVMSVIVAVMFVALGVILVVQPALSRPAPAPDVRPVIEAYLDAVADGDATAALAMSNLDPSNVESASSALLGDEVLGAARERIADPEIVTVKTAGSGASLAMTTVAFTLAGERIEADLQLRFDEDAKEWKVIVGLVGTLEVKGLDGDAVPIAVAGVTPDPDAECFGPCGRESSYVLFAGVYDLHADLSGFEMHPRNDTPADRQVTVVPNASAIVTYLAVPQGDPWPTVNGKPTDPSPDATDG